MTKLLSCRYNMDTNRVEARFADGTTLAIDCIAVEDEYGHTPAQRAELDWLLYNKPLELSFSRLRPRQAGGLIYEIARLIARVHSPCDLFSTNFSKHTIYHNFIS